MAALVYTPASGENDWLLVQGAACVLVRSSDFGSDRVAKLWHAVRSSDPLRGALDVLASEGVTSAPAFALVDWSGSPSDKALVVVRGDVRVLVVDNAGETTVDATSVATWRETSFLGAMSIQVGARDDASLPLTAGVVHATGATLSASETASEPSVAPKVVAETAVVEAVPAASAAPATAPIPLDAAQPELVENTIAEPSDVGDGGYAHLFEETVVRSVEEAAVRPDEADEADEEPAERQAPRDTDPDVAPDGDHDGQTVMSGDLAKLRAAAEVPAPSAPSAPAVTPTPARRDFHLELSTGAREPLAQPVLIGRSPSATKVSSGQVPRLVAITGDQDISRNHAEFSLQGGTVVVTDLHSRNGTIVTMPGKSAQRLRAGEPTPVLVDTVVDLGSGITITVRES